MITRAVGLHAPGASRRAGSSLDIALAAPWPIRKTVVYILYTDLTPPHAARGEVPNLSGSSSGAKWDAYCAAVARSAMETGPICQKSCISAETVVRTLYTTVPAPCAWPSSRPPKGVDCRVHNGPPASGGGVGR